MTDADTVRAALGTRLTYEDDAARAALANEETP